MNPIFPRKPCPFGSYRSLEPAGALPQLAWRLNTQLPIMGNEVLIQVKTLNINAASFAQLRLEAGGDPAQIIRRVCDIVAMRGKLQNPITGSGGTLMGFVEEVGHEHPAYGELMPGDPICTLVSLNLTPLVLKRVKSVNMRTGQMEVEGYGILFETSLYTRVPSTMPTNLFLAVFGEAGSCYEANLLARPGITAAVVGAAEKVGLLSLFALRRKLGQSGRLIAIAEQRADEAMLRDLGIVDQVLVADVISPLSAYREIKEKLSGAGIDLTVDCISRPGAEMFSVLITREKGTVYFANPATQFSVAGLGAEGIGKELELLFYRGYIKGHVPFCIRLVEENPALARCFSDRYSPLNSQDVYTYSAPEAEGAVKFATNIVVHSPEMAEIVRIAQRIAPFNTTVLITGESGTGKEVVADIVWQSSDRQQKPFLKINCAAISDSLFESELFGYEAGSFTGALKGGKAGYFEQADGGTLFLDEIGELSLSSQVKLLRVLQSKEVVRVGGSQPVPVDVRVIAATNRDLSDMVTRGEFREDLYYRLNVINLHVPPLRERRNSILPLVESFLRQYNRLYQVQKGFSDRALELLLEYDWPGNIREMENLIQRLLLCSDRSLITEQDLRRELHGGKPPAAPGSPPPASPQPLSNEEDIYRDAAARYHSTREIARALHTSQSTVVRRLKKYGLRPGGSIQADSF